MKTKMTLCILSLEFLYRKLEVYIIGKIKELMSGKLLLLILTPII